MEPAVQAEAQNVGEARPVPTAKIAKSRKDTTDSVWLDWVFMAFVIVAGILVAALAMYSG